MSQESVQRRLAAILAADVVGYSKLMGADETGTITALKAHRSQLFEPKAAQHNGRTVKLMGDGELMEFPSVVEAVRCAVEIQCAMAERNKEVPGDKRIEFRMGVNVGDVVVDGDDIYGDGVNIAARVESLADTGGVFLSRAARDQVRDRLDLDIIDKGEVTAKNIARPIRLFAIDMNDKARLLMTPIQPLRPPSRRSWKLASMAGTLAAVLVAALLWWQPWSREQQPRLESASRQGPSIAVLPFANNSDDDSQKYFSAGITEDINTDLSKVAGLFVTPNSATRRYAGKDVSSTAVAKDLGVGHVLEGSVRRANGQLRITARLIDATTGVQVWAERFDRDINDVFEIQDEISNMVVERLSATLKSGELERAARRYTPNVEAYDLYIQGRATRIPPTPKNLTAALQMFDRAIELDPKFAGGYAGASYVHLLRYGTPGISPADELNTALEFAKKAVELDPTFGPAWGTLGEAYSRAGQFDEAEQAIERAIETAPNDSLIRATYGRLLGHIGQPEAGIEQVKQAMRMSPDSLPMLYFLGANYRAAGQFEDAIKALTEHRHRLGGRVIPPPTTQLIAAYAQAGKLEEARAEAKKLLNVAPGFTVQVAARTHSYKSKDEMDQFLGVLREAGVPNDPD